VSQIKKRATTPMIQQLIERALTVVQRMGHPTYFITFTCNADWPEIKENLLPGQVSSDRPLLVARVFKLKLKRFLATIKKWDGGCAYYFCVVEFQHRGLPHAHIALRVNSPPPLTNNMRHIQVDMPMADADSYRRLVGTLSLDQSAAAAPGQPQSAVGCCLLPAASSLPVCLDPAILSYE
jgi:hypothetical protein